MNTPFLTIINTRARACLSVGLVLLSQMMISCFGESAGRHSGSQPIPPDTAAMHRMEGIWVDAETGSVILMIRGDSIFYPDTTNIPAAFSIVGDSLITSVGGNHTSYLIVEQGDYNFSYEALTGEVIHMQKSDEVEDSLEFSRRSYAPILMGSFVRRDTVVYTPDGERLHLYIDVNPTKKKVYRTTYTDEGMSVSNIYYDNIIHICVYSGKRRVFSRDISKTAFEELIPSTFLDEAILSNMSFGRVDNSGCHFNATVCNPEGASCYVVDILVSNQGDCSFNVLEY